MRKAIDPHRSMTQTTGGKSEVVMSCQTQVTNYYKLKYQVLQATESPEPQPGLIKRLEAEEYTADGAMLTCVRGMPAVQPVFALGGTWNYGGKPGPVISCLGNLMTIDMSAYPGLPGTEIKKRATAGGLILDNSDIWVYFPDDNAYTGRLQAPNLIVWSNNSEWVKA
jgi:hypothetical protein